MYLNDIHILYYVLLGFIGLFIGSIINWCNYRLPEHKNILSVDILKKEERKHVKKSLMIPLLNGVIYVGLLYTLGIDKNLFNNINLIELLILTPMLISALYIDFKYQIIPNRLNLSIFEIGLIFTYINSLINISIAFNRLLGMIIGGGIFLIITIIGGIASKKEAMGMGDVKLISALGLYFGVTKILYVTIIAFLLASIVSIFILIINFIFRRKKMSKDGYIAFGPFIVMGCFFTIFIPFPILTKILLEIFTLGKYI